MNSSETKMQCFNAFSKKRLSTGFSKPDVPKVMYLHNETLIMVFSLGYNSPLDSWQVSVNQSQI